VAHSLTTNRRLIGAVRSTAVSRGRDTASLSCSSEKSADAIFERTVAVLGLNRVCFEMSEVKSPSAKIYDSTACNAEYELFAVIKLGMERSSEGYKPNFQENATTIAREKKQPEAGGKAGHVTAQQPSQDTHGGSFEQSDQSP
jgi:hypothetical protein